ncbi:MAG: RHS repeat-associated core domain-containing protein [Pyrinomonadaceae bacterium]
MPFGEEIYTAQRTQSLGYTADTIRKQFTGYERDNEIALDFAQARMYLFIGGRFSSPDPFGPWAMTEKEKTRFFLEPQNWNLYVYVTNSPLKFSDPTGFERYDPNTVSAEDKEKIQKALKAILDYGTPLQKRIVRNIQKSDLLIKIGTNIGGSGTTGVTDSAATQKKIDTQRLNEVQALGELTITIDSGTLASQIGIEGTLVHETRHASHQARAISEFSWGDQRSGQPYNPDGFALEYSAHKSYADYVVQANRLNHPNKQAFVNEALSMKVVEQNGGGIGVSEKGIRERSANAYNLNDTTNRGATFSQNWGLTPRNSW